MGGLSPAAAAEYSFLASLPIMAGVTAKVLIEDLAYLQAHAAPLVVGNIVAFIAGLLAVTFLMGYLSRHSLALFGWYRIVLAGIITIIILLQ